jgi:hypothetical protein
MQVVIESSGFAQKLHKNSSCTKSLKAAQKVLTSPFTYPGFRVRVAAITLAASQCPEASSRLVTFAKLVNYHRKIKEENTHV